MVEVFINISDHIMSHQSMSLQFSLINQVIDNTRVRIILNLIALKSLRTAVAKQFQAFKTVYIIKLQT